jgi:phytanoyl-CoA hydroxylase
VTEIRGSSLSALDRACRNLNRPTVCKVPGLCQTCDSFNLHDEADQDLLAGFCHPSTSTSSHDTSEMMDALSPIADYPLTQDHIDQYRRDGFIVLPDVVTGPVLDALRSAVEAAVEQETNAAPVERGKTLGTYEKIFNQKVNLWRRHANVARFTLSRALGTIAARLEGVPMRIWHDQALFKAPGLGENKTPWHQDAVYWPHQDRWRQTTIWLALRDATARNGCMSFLPGTQGLGPMEPINLADPADIFADAPHLSAIKPTICPLTAGSATFHNGLSWHYAGPNRSDAVREAYAIIFMPDGTVFDGKPHIVTDDLGLSVGDRLQGETFPLVS